MFHQPNLKTQVSARVIPRAFVCGFGSSRWRVGCQNSILLQIERFLWRVKTRFDGSGRRRRLSRELGKRGADILRPHDVALSLVEADRFLERGGGFVWPAGQAQDRGEVRERPRGAVAVW